MSKHKLIRKYEVEVHGLYYDEEAVETFDISYALEYSQDELVMDAKQLQAHMATNNWPYSQLMDAATRYADMGDNEIDLYLYEWTVSNDGTRAKDWGRWNDIDHDGTIHCGPVRVTARETEWAVY